MSNTGLDYVQERGFEPITWDAFQALSSGDSLTHAAQVANLFFEGCVTYNRNGYMRGNELFAYFESFCEWVDCWHVNRAVTTEWLADQWKTYAESIHNKDVQLGWFIYHDFPKEGAHLLILGVSCTILDGMRHPDEPVMVTADYDPEANTIKIE